MRDYDEVVRLVYGGDDIRHGGSGKVHDFRTALSASIYLRSVAQQYRDFALPRLFALEAEDWRRAEHPTEEMSAELLQEESFEDFLFAPCSSDIQSYFQVLSVGDWEQLLKEYLEDNTDAILKAYHELFNDYKKKGEKKMELIWIDALDDKAYSEECRKKGVGRDDIDVVDPAEFRDICHGPFRQDCDFFFEMLPDGWIAPDLYNWCTEILLRDDKGRLVKIETDWDEDYFDDSASDYPTISTGGDPADINSMTVCAKYIEKYTKEIDDWYRAHPKKD